MLDQVKENDYCCKSCYNLCKSWEKTLLIDTDLRRPVVHKAIGINKEPGITDYLSNNEKDITKIIQKTEIKDLCVIPSGIIPPNPSELLGSDRMSNLLRDLEDEWDMILFDSPPLVAVTRRSNGL